MGKVKLLWALPPGEQHQPRPEPGQPERRFLRCHAHAPSRLTTIDDEQIEPPARHVGAGNSHGITLGLRRGDVPAVLQDGEESSDSLADAPEMERW